MSWTAAVSGAAIPDAVTLSREGDRALAEGLPQVAAGKYGDLLRLDPPPAIRRPAVLAMSRALVAAGQSSLALDLLAREFPAAIGDSVTVYTRAQALAAVSRWTEALADYTSVEGLAVSTETVREAQLGRVEALVALRRSGEALEISRKLADVPGTVGALARLRGAEIALDADQLKEVVNFLLGRTSESHRPFAAEGRSVKNERNYLIGRLRLAQKQTALAEEIFGGASGHPEGLSERLLACNFRGWAQACLEQGKLAQAEDVLESFVSVYPRSRYLDGILASLRELYDRNPGLPNLADLRRWAADPLEPLRQAPALLLLAHMEEALGHPEASELAAEALVKTFPEHPLRMRAALDVVALELRQNHLTEARASLDEARKLPAPAGTDPRAEIDMLDARLYLAEDNSAKAAALFESIAGRAGLSDAQVEASSFNAVLSWLRTSDADRFAATERVFLERFPRSPLGAELTLEEGLARAARAPVEDRNGRQRAAAALRRFLRDNGNHPRATEARIALAELAFERPRPNVGAAWNQLSAPGMRRIDNPGGGPPNAYDDRAAYLSIWLADTPGPSQDSKKAVALAKRFLDARPDSPLAAEVRMKLCEIYFRSEDYSDAQTQLELLVEKSPESPLAESALYLAGLSAERSMSTTGLDNAVLLFQKAAQYNGPFKLPSRLRQAEVQRRLGNYQDALTLYKEVFRATGAAISLEGEDLESHCAALAGQGETLFILGGKDPKSCREAASVFETLANGTAGAPFAWRRQALTQKGQALEGAGDPTAALVAYNDALDAEPAEGSLPREPEWTWFYRAGSNAARLLESQSQWAGAIAVYKKLAAVDGPLKAEYENLISRRRLEHFIWED